MTRTRLFLCYGMLIVELILDREGLWIRGLWIRWLWNIGDNNDDKRGYNYRLLLRSVVFPW